MPCSRPMQVYCKAMPNGKSDIRFSNVLGRMFQEGQKMPEGSMAVACGQCMFCRLERSRENALRCVHEAKMSENNCFITLTLSDEKLKEMCPKTEGGYTLVRKHAQDFMKRLREKFRFGWTYRERGREEEKRFTSDNIRAFGCGEYGDRTSRPHYHFCLFNCSFPDREFWKTVNKFKYYNSKCLNELWPHGHSVISDFSFETAAYIGRYCCKKVTGSLAKKHYLGRLPEFGVFPTRGGGLGKGWFEKFGKSDVLPTDTCIINGAICKPPRYYDRLRERIDPNEILRAKILRKNRAKDKAEDNTYTRLLDKEKCMNARIHLLVRRLEG